MDSRPDIRDNAGMSEKKPVRICDALEPNAPGFCQLIYGHTGPHRNGNHGWPQENARSFESMCNDPHPSNYEIRCTQDAGHETAHQSGPHVWNTPCRAQHPKHWGITCDKMSGHYGAHMADVLGSEGDDETWHWNGSTDCGAVKIAQGGIQLFCQRPTGHGGDHRRSDVWWPRTVLVSRKKTQRG